MPLTQFKTVRLRLLAGMALIIAPIAILGVLLALTTYRSVVEGIELSESRITSYLAARTLAWFRGASRSLLAASVSIDPSADRAADCGAALRRVIDANQGYAAIRVRFEGGLMCEASLAGAPGSDELEALAQDQATRSHVRLWLGAASATGRFDAVRIGGKLYLLVDVQNGASPNSRLSALLLADPKILERSIQLDPTDRGVAFAVMKRGGELIAARGAVNGRVSWLPEEERLGSGMLLWRAASRSGVPSLYGAQTISEPNLYVLARFDDRARDAAWRQFLILCATTLIVILLLMYLYAQIVQKDVLRWIHAIDVSARSQLAQRGEAACAPVDPSMPVELRSVSESFNAMIADADRREGALRRLLRVNRELMRELHHRVKNSLQIIQSYLALLRREQTGANKRCLAETEARVQVLASAYRLGLNAGGMGMASVKPFLAEIEENVISFARGSQQEVSISFEWSGAMIIDRIIPLGLAFVEILIGALSAPGAGAVKVVLRRLNDKYLELSVMTVGAPIIPPSEKIMAGLVAQLSAKREWRDEGRAFVLTFPP